MYASFLCKEEDAMEKLKIPLEGETDEILNQLGHLCIILPSDPTWRTENYFRLVELHRSKTDTHRKVSKVLPRKLFQKGFPTLGLWALRSSERRTIKSPFLTIDSEPQINWNDKELITAGRVLSDQVYSTVFLDNDPDRMRKIIGLVYDVLRYKKVLSEVLADIRYFHNFPEDQTMEKKVWLLLYNMICRGFRERKEEMFQEDKRTFEEIGLNGIHERLWENKIQIAATVSRIRIRKQAESLADLLPRRIKLPSKIVNNPIVEGWMNIYRIPWQEIGDRFKNLGFTRHVGREALPPLTFSEDHLLPYHYYCRPFTRSTFLNSSFVKNTEFIIQSRTNCYSASIICEVMKTNELVGSVAQTDVVALPASGYIAALLWINRQLSSRLLIFGAGSKKDVYESYFNDLGVSNVFIISERFCEIDPNDPRLEGVVLVFACPPSSNSSVLDPVDFSIARGGDMCILKELTSKTDEDNQPESYITKIQRDTLQRALSIPQVQGVVYETYSEFVTENSILAKSVVDEMNKWAAHKHFTETIDEPSQEMETPDLQDTPKNFKEIQVPVCDLFELSPLPDICPHEKNCLALENEGVYIGLIMRKKITRLDSKFMISMAEERGLFGSGNKEATHDLEKVISEERPSSSNEKRFPRAKVNMKRISAPTFCSKLRSVRECRVTRCERSRITRKITISKIWWNALLSHVKFHLKHKIYKIKFGFPRRNIYYSRRRKRTYSLPVPEIKLTEDQKNENVSGEK